MPKQKSLINPTNPKSPAKTIKSLFTKSTTLLAKLEAKIQIFKTEHDAWTQEIQAITTQIGLMEEGMKNPQILFSTDFRKNFGEIIKKFNKIKEGTDDEQNGLNKIMEEFQTGILACIASAKKKATDIPLETGLATNIKLIDNHKVTMQKLIQELFASIQILDKRLSANETLVNRLTIQPHIVELAKQVEKLCFGFELLCKETISVSTPSSLSMLATSSAEDISKIQFNFLQLYVLCKKMDPLLEQSKTNLAKAIVSNGSQTAGKEAADNKSSANAKTSAAL